MLDKEYLGDNYFTSRPHLLLLDISSSSIPKHQSTCAPFHFHGKVPGLEAEASHVPFHPEIQELWYLEEATYQSLRSSCAMKVKIPTLQDCRGFE